MKFQYIIVDKLSGVPSKHKKALISWFGYQFFVISLCVINSVFLICNWQDLRLQINDTTNILLTIIGFLFAFAGINIYSIFNTNIETEKSKMIELQQQYSLQLNNSMQRMDFYRNIYKLQLYTQLILSSSQANSQLFEWADKVSKLCHSINDYLKQSQGKMTKDEYDHIKADLLALLRGLKYQTKAFCIRVKVDNAFYGEMDEENQKLLMEQIQNMLSPINYLDEDDGDLTAFPPTGKFSFTYFFHSIFKKVCCLFNRKRG